MTTRAATGPCRNCGQQMTGFLAGEHDVCGIFCAVWTNAPIDGLTDAEIAAHFVDELAGALSDYPTGGDEEYAMLQRGLAQLLFYFVEADDLPERGRLAGQLETFLRRTRVR